MVSQRVVTGNLGGPKDDRIYGIGHAPLPAADSGKAPQAYYTNWLELNGSGSLAAAGLTEGPTNYAATRRAGPSCMVEPSFLYCARERGRNDQRPREACGGMPKPEGTRWDFGAPGRSKGETRPTELLGRTYDSFADRGRAQSNVQLAAGAWPKDRRKDASNAPAWGIRTDQSTIIRHGGVASAPLLCMFNKLMLDEANVRPGPGEGPCRYESRYRERLADLIASASPLKHRCLRTPEFRQGLTVNPRR